MGLALFVGGGRPWMGKDRRKREFMFVHGFYVDLCDDGWLVLGRFLSYHFISFLTSL
jgi:hypothetical protein